MHNTAQSLKSKLQREYRNVFRYSILFDVFCGDFTLTLGVFFFKAEHGHSNELKASYPGHFYTAEIIIVF